MSIKGKAKLIKALAKVVKANRGRNGNEYVGRLANQKIVEIIKSFEHPNPTNTDNKNKSH